LKGIASHYDNSYAIPTTTLLCRDAIVSLQHRNFLPKWGLYNGSMGVVRDIIYKKGQSPNSGHLPKYTVVEFHAYTGPEWSQENPTTIPIPNVKSSCRFNCCWRIHPPLKLDFAKTIHSTQGVTAGPAKEG